ncbi:MAG: type II toxin-antitoxin system RelE/ParE family toxin [Terriglobia bacterium]
MPDQTLGRSPYAAWFSSLNAPAAAKVTTAITRLAQGNLSNPKSVGGGALECRINFGPACRVYVGRDGDCLVILLGGGTKARQQKDVGQAIARWH